jgi:hypothetical protein
MSVDYNKIIFVLAGDSMTAFLMAEQLALDTKLSY